MNVLLLARWFLMFVQFLIVVTAEDGTCRSDDVAGNLTAVLPTCPNDTFTFLCTVVGDSSGAIHWRVGRRECFLPHSTMRDPHPCGSDSPFIARTETGFETTGATSFTSTLSGIATSELNGTLVECFVQHDSDSNTGQPPCRNSENMVGNITLQIVGPDIVNISCHHLSNLYNENINVTVSWTLSSRNCADFYLINITTNAPQTPYGGFLKINTGNITWHELTGFMAGYEYNITVRGTCAGGQKGSESEPLPFTPKVPDAPAYCNCTVIYNQSSGMLQFINSTWNTVESAVDPCPGISGVIKSYKMDYQTNIVNINVSMCMNGRCSHTFEPPSNPPSSYDSVSVAAVNVVGVGAVRNCTTQTINTTNNHLTGGIVDLSSPNIAVLFCEFLSGFTGSARCRVQYGTDPTYMNLPYSAESTETGTAGNSVSVMLRERLNSSTDYYYTVSAVSGDITVTVLAEPFATPLYNCSPMDLWNQTITNANFSPSVGLLDDATQYPNCGNRSVGSAVFRDTTVNTATVAYYTGTTTGSRACFVCNNDSGYELTTDAGNVCDEGNDCEPNTTINERVCKSDGTWSGSPITCVCTLPSLLEWHISLMVIGALFLVLGILIIVCRTLGYCWWRCKGSTIVTSLTFDEQARTLTCTYTGGLATNVTWRRDGVVITLGVTYQETKGVVDGTYQTVLTIDPSVRWSDIVGTYNCTVENDRGESSKTVIVPEHLEMSICAKKVKILCIVLLVIGASFCGIGVVLWIAVRGVVDNHTNHDVCDTDWHRSRDGLIITAFVCSIIALLMACTFTVLVGCYRSTFPGDKKRLLWLLICSLAVYYPGDVAAQFVAAPPTCPGDNLIFNCTVGDMNGVTLWRVGGSECVLVHNTPSDPHSCRSGSPFIASTGTGFGTNATNFTSTLKAIANSTQDGTLVECFGPAFSRGPGNLVGNSVLQILGPPFVSTLSCVGLSEDVSGAVNVTVSWTLSDGDSADFYLINITTNAPQTPYGGLLNITNVIVTQQELTGFVAGYEYNITVRGVTLDCGGLVGRESEFLTITPQGPSIIATLSCVGLSANVSGAVNVIVSWTLSGGDSADFYLINITTNAPQTPYRGLLNITTASVTQHELTGFMAGYQYNITVRGVNCGSQEGSEPLTITPQVPASPTSNVCAVYKENRVLLIIENTWNEVNNVTVSKDCVNGQNIRASYELTYTTDSSTPIATCIVDGTECSNGTCHYELHSNTADSRCNAQVSQFTGSVNVSLTARNIVGRSIAVSRRINGRNIDLEAFIDTTNLSSVFVECTFFQPGYTCTIAYGTDPSYTNLVYRDTSSTLDRTATINLSQSLRGDTTYYYIVSAVSSSQCVRVRGRFQAGCNKADLLHEGGPTNPSRCTDRGFMNSSFITGGVVCYNGTAVGSRAVYICSDGYNLMEGNEATRVCQSDGSWNGSIPQCIPEEGDCSPMELWDLPAAGFTIQTDVSLLDDEATKYPSCDAEGVGSVVLRDIALNTATVAYYTGNSTGSRACFVCDAESGYAPNATINERDCQTDETWSRSSIVCACTLPHLPELSIALIASGIITGLVSIVLTIILTVTAVCFSRMTCKNKCFTYSFMVSTGAFSTIGVILLIAAAVVASTSQDNPCDPSWRNNRDGLTYSGFASSIASFIALFIALLTQFFLWKFAPKQCAKDWRFKRNERCRSCAEGCFRMMKTPLAESDLNNGATSMKDVKEVKPSMNKPTFDNE